MLGNTPASTAAFSLDAPRAIASQNRTRCSRRPADGCPPQRVPAAAARFHARFLLGITTPNVRRCDNQLNPPHHRRVIRSTTRPTQPIHRLKPLEIHLLDRPQNRPHQMILRQPVRQRRRHQQQLTTITTNEVQSHTGSVLNGPDSTDIPTASRRRNRALSARLETVAIVSAWIPNHAVPP